jgi:hypothetical protein
VTYVKTLSNRIWVVICGYHTKKRKSCGWRRGGFSKPIPLQGKTLNPPAASKDVVVASQWNPVESVPLARAADRYQPRFLLSQLLRRPNSQGVITDVDRVQ